MLIAVQSRTDPEGEEEALPTAGALVTPDPLSLEAFRICRDEPVGRASALRGPALALAAAVLLHGGVLAAVLQRPPSPLGNAGRELDVISVDVVIVPGSASRANAGTGHADTDVAASSGGAPGASAASSSAHPKAKSPTSNSARTEAPHPSSIDPAGPSRHAEAARTSEVEGMPPAAGDRQGLPLKQREVDGEVAAKGDPHQASPSEVPDATTALPMPARESKPHDVAFAAAPPAALPEPEPLQAAPSPRPASPGRPAADEGIGQSSPASGAPAPPVPGAAARSSGAKSTASPGEVRAFDMAVAKQLAKVKPQRSRDRATGTVRLAFTIGVDGTLADVQVQRSSGNRALDERAISAVRRAEFPIPPEGMSSRQRSYIVPYMFR